MNIETIAVIVAGVSSAISTGAAILAIVLTIRFTQRQIFTSALQNNVQMMLSVQSMLKDNIQLLRFYGISKKELKEAGISSEELVFLLNNFTAGLAFYAPTQFNQSKSFPPGTLRYILCSNDAVRKAWPLLRRMMNDGPYLDQIEATFAEIYASRIVE